MKNRLTVVGQWIKTHPYRTGLLIFVAVGLILYFGEFVAPWGLGNWSGFQGKTFWDVLQLAIIPLVLGVGAYFFNRSERYADNAIAESRLRAERAIAAERWQEETLQHYLDRMTELLLDKGLRNLNDLQQSEARSVAITRTLTVLRSLDGKRKGAVIRFLGDAGLLKGPQPIITLARADLRGADLANVNLEDAELTGANLSSARLAESSMADAVLEEAVLTGADLTHALLLGTIFFRADLGHANLFRATLTKADFREADLRDSILDQAEMNGADLGDAQLDRASLDEVDLTGANLRGAQLQHARFVRSDLTNSKLVNAVFDYADLREALVTTGQLATAKSLSGATMPDGTKHE
jgi:uncharacterized protein YjbI with pentapeptide repeats